MAETLQRRLRRLLLLVPYVIRRPEVTVGEVCEQFGIIRRQLVADLDLLFLCGRPGYGPGDLIEAFVDGDHIQIRMAEYFAQPLRLSPAEGLLLYSGAQALAAAGAGDDALDRALRRLEEVLGPDVVARVSVAFGGTEEIATVHEALTRERRLHIVYQSHSKEEVTERDVDPWALFASGGRWYLVGWCHRVRDERMFRVDRMRTVTLVDAPAQVPEDVDLARYERLYVTGPGAERVVVDIAPDARWVTEYYPLESQEPLADGWLRITLTAGGTAWLERLLLRLGTHARVVEPPDLGRRVHDLACRLLERYR